jgi:hypothetical protein
MRWTARTEKETDTKTLENRLWAAQRLTRQLVSLTLGSPRQSVSESRLLLAPRRDSTVPREAPLGRQSALAASTMTLSAAVSP